MGFLAVALGAFGAHKLRPVLEQSNQLAHWNTAAHYHLIHAAVLLAIALHGAKHVWPWRLILVGTVIFSGTLYIISVTGMSWLGRITPIGGTLLILGWLALIPWRKEPRS
jgi:uncharacterized membrane protein YgdD (TMEM256/DUF423 family)